MAQMEFQQIQLQTEADAESSGNKGSFQVFTDPHYRKRLGIAIGLVCFAQSNGILLIYSRISISSLQLFFPHRILTNLYHRLQLYYLHHPWFEQLCRSGSLRWVDYVHSCNHGVW